MGSIENFFDGIKGLKRDFKDDFIDNFRSDFKVDWSTVPVTLPVGHVAISNTALPLVTGTGTPGSTLTVSNGTWLGTPTPTFTYQWFSSYTGPIPGANSNTYVVTNEAGAFGIFAKVTATNVDSTVTATSNTVSIVLTPAAPVNTSLPVISGNALVDSMLTVDPGVWTGVPTPLFTYQWKSSLATIASLGTVTPGSGYTPGFYSDVPLTGGSGVGAVGQVQINPAGQVFSVTISAGNGNAGAGYVAGDSLSFSPSRVGGTGSGGSVLVATVTHAIQNATDKVYLTQLVDATATLTCTVTATNFPNGVQAQGFATSANFGPIALTQTAPSNSVAVTITGTAHVGQTLTAVPGTWAGGPTPRLTYQWLSAGVPIAVGETVEVDGDDNQVTNTTIVSHPGQETSDETDYVSVMATGLTYVIQASDVGNAIQVVETGSNVAGSESVTSVATAVVPVVPVSNLTLPVVSGSGKHGTLLSATAGTWAGAPAPSFSFQWMSGSNPVQGESGPAINLVLAANNTSSYQVQASDIGHTITCVVTAINTSNITASSLTAPGGNPGVDLMNGTYTNVPLYNGSGTGAVATVVVSGGLVTSITLTNQGTGYAVGDELTALQQFIGGVGYPFTLIVTAVGTSVTATSNGVVAS